MSPPDDESRPGGLVLPAALEQRLLVIEARIAACCPLACGSRCTAVCPMAVTSDREILTELAAGWTS